MRHGQVWEMVKCSRKKRSQGECWQNKRYAVIIWEDYLRIGCNSNQCMICQSWF